MQRIFKTRPRIEVPCAFGPQQCEAKHVTEVFTFALVPLRMSSGVSARTTLADRSVSETRSLNCVRSFSVTRVALREPHGVLECDVGGRTEITTIEVSNYFDAIVFEEDLPPRDFEEISRMSSTVGFSLS